ncbi:MAG: hypothetical protein AMXMBFR83_18380 [Phycisphaerae bacterium]
MRAGRSRSRTGRNVHSPVSPRQERASARTAPFTDPHFSEVSRHRLRLIASFSGKIVGDVPLARQAQETAEQVRATFGVDACVVRLLEGDDLVLLAATGIPKRRLHPRVPVDFGISKRIIALRRPIFIPDITKDPDIARAQNRLTPAYHFTSYAGTPLLVKDQVIGIFGIYTIRRMDDFSDADLDYLQIFGNNLSAAILNERLYEEVTRQRDRLEAEVAERARAERALRESQEQLIQARKMESIGTLAGGIAHDFGNVLAVILGNVSVLQRQPGLTPKMRRLLADVATAAERGSAFTQQLLAYAHGQSRPRTLVNLNRLVETVSGLLERLKPPGVVLVLEPADGLPEVLGDGVQIEQVVLNLVLNAIEASGSKGRVEVRTGQQKIGEQEAFRLGRPAGTYVFLQVKDQGSGIDAGARERIFEPFFTTKPMGRGMGLATARAIIDGHQGHISVESTVGEGTTITVYLPVPKSPPVRRAGPRKRRTPPGSRSRRPAGPVALRTEADAAVRSIAG